MEQVIAVGDGANDLPMLRLAGLGIAFHAKPLVRQSARQAISTLGLDGILYLLGVRDREALVAD
jgi:phosphoserine phosphatase